MAERCVKLGCIEFLRLALQNPCTGAPVPGATNGALIGCTRNSTLEKRVRDAEVSEFVSDCNVADQYTQDAQLLGFNVSFEVSRLSPELEALLNGDELLVSGGTNVGVIYEAAAGCSGVTPDPRFIVEAFIKVRECSAGASAGYVRYVIPGVSFTPSEIDKEGQITFPRYSGTSDPTLTDGLLSVNDGPYADFPAGIVTALGALDSEHMTPGLWFADTTDPTAGLTLAAGSCYTATVPIAAGP